jgi:hypothetical protein
MNRFQMTRLLVVLAMLLSIAGGPRIASGNGCGGSGKVCANMSCCHGMACCAVKEKQPAGEQRTPVQQQVGRDIGAAVTTTPFSVLFTFGPTEAKRAPRALFAAGHAPEPLAASCIWLI